MLEARDIEDMFKFHPPKDETVSELHSQVRVTIRDAALWAFKTLPECPERDKAIEKLREAMFWSNAAVACNQKNRG